VLNDYLDARNVSFCIKKDDSKKIYVDVFDGPAAPAIVGEKN